MGVLWERKFTDSRSYSQQNKQNTCKEAAKIEEEMAVNFIVLGHTTHKEITTYCNENAWPAKVFAVDTSLKLCQRGFVVKAGDECDFEAGRDLQRQNNPAPYNNGFLPSSLHIAQNRWIVKCTYDNTPHPVCTKLLGL